MIIVIGSVTARPNSFEALKQACLDHTRRSRTEPGCLSHAVHVDVEDPLRMFFFERWSDMAALRIHFTTPGTATFLAAAREHAASSERITTYQADETAP
jgi:quinol monooxygenase YgiN